MTVTPDDLAYLTQFFGDLCYEATKNSPVVLTQAQVIELARAAYARGLVDGRKYR